MRRLWLAVLLIGNVPAARAEESVSAEEGKDVFLSLTRTAEKRENLPTNLSVVTAQDIRAAGAITLDQALDLLPSATLNRTGTLGANATIRLRGVPTSNDVQIVVDDQPLGGVGLQDIDLSQIPLDDVERIEVLRGGSSVLYGANTIGGVVHIITRRHADEKPLTRVNYEGHSFATRKYGAEFGARSGRGDVFVTGGRWFTQGFQENSDADGVSATGRAGWSLGNGARIDAALSHVNTETGLPGGTPVPLGLWDGNRERAAADLTTRLDQKRSEGRLKLSVPVGRAGLWETRLSGTTLDYVSQGLGADTDKLSMQGETLWRPAGRTLAGLSYTRDRLKERVTGPVTAHDVDWGAFVQSSADVGDLEVTPAFRFDQHNAFGNQYNPRVTFVYRLTDGMALSSNVARSFRAPTLVNLYQDFGFFKNNPNLKPETAWGEDLGWRTRVGAHGALSVTGFYLKIRDRISDIDLTGDGFGDINVNAPTAELSGAEVEASHQLGSLRLSGNYTYQRALGSATGRSQHLALPFTPRHLANGTVGWNAPHGWAFSQSLRYVHRQFSGEGDTGAKLPSFTLWDARVTKHVLAADLTFAVENITDKHYAESRGFAGLVPQPGRTIWGGMSVAFAD